MPTTPSLVSSAGYLALGFKLILHPRLRRFVIVPLAVNTVLFVGLIAVSAHFFSALVNGILALLPHWMNWLRWLLWPLFTLMVVIVGFFSFSLLANLIGAPFNGLLAEAVEKHLTGKPVINQSWAIMLLGILPGLFNEWRKFLYFIVRAVPLLILFLIPGVNVIAPFAWMAFSAWMLALQYLDYPMSNHGLLFATQRQKIHGKRPQALVFGGTALIATLIPGLNFFVMPAAVAGATALWLDMLSENTR